MKDIARADIKPAFAVRNVPVALATDENYLPYLKVAINSAIANSPGSNLDIIVLHAGIPEDAIRTFVAGYAGAGHATVRFVDISDELVASGLSGYKQTARLPLSACYRLLLPSVLAAYDKVVYLDVDVAVCRDLGELYATDVGDNYFAAAKDVVYTTKPEYVSWAAKWGFAEWDGYVNTGVLIMNLERFRREPVFDRLKEIVFEAAKWNCDQDALNFVCKGAIAPLDPRWNVQLGDYCISKQIALTGEEMWIAHFTSRQKPWKCPVRRFSHLWWRYVDATDAVRFWKQAWGHAPVLPSAGTPMVSVVIPVYNTANYLRQCLDSVANQTLRDIEIICVDDGSKDGSAEIAGEYAAADSRFSVIRQPHAGVGAARNKGLSVARGEYVYFLDSDDWVESEALERLLDIARLERLDLVLCAVEAFVDDSGGNQDSVEAVRLASMTRYDMPADLVNMCMSGAEMALALQGRRAYNALVCARLIKREILECCKIKFPTGVIHEDEFFTAVLHAASSRAMAVHDGYFHRRFRNGSIMTSQDNAGERLRGVLAISKLIKEYAQTHYMDDCIERDFLHMRERRLEDRFLARAKSMMLNMLPPDCRDIALSIFMERLERNHQLQRSKLESAKAQVARRDEWLVAEKAKTARVEINLAAVKSKLEAVKSQVARRDEWLAAEKAKTARAEEKLSTAQAKLEATKAQVARRDGWLAAEKAKTARAEEKLSTAQAKLEAAKAQVARRDGWLAAEKAKNERAEAKLAEERGKVSRRDKWLEKEKVGNEKLQARVESQERLLAARDAELRSKDAELARLRKSAETLAAIRTVAG